MFIIKLLLGSSLFYYENGFVGAKDPMDSTTRNFQTFINSHYQLFNMEIEHSMNFTLSKNIQPSNTTLLYATERNDVLDADEKGFHLKIPFHPWLHTLPVTLPHPKFPQLTQDRLWLTPSAYNVIGFSLETIYMTSLALQNQHIAIPKTLLIRLFSFFLDQRDGEVLLERDKENLVGTFGKVRPCYYPHSMYIPNLLKNYYHTFYLHDFLHRHSNK